MTRVKLYGLGHSHAVVASRLMLDRAGVDYEFRRLRPGSHMIAVRALGFPGRTVPAMRIDGRRVQGTLPIAREIDRLVPDAGIFPPDPRERAAVEAAERLGHDELQPLARRAFIWAQANDAAVRAWFAREVLRLRAPAVAAVLTKPVSASFARFAYGGTAAAVRADLARLPELLDHADVLIEEGAIGGPRPNAGDFQVFASLRQLSLHSDLRPLLERWRCGRMALKLIPDYPGAGRESLPPLPAALPRKWLAGLRPVETDTAKPPEGASR